MVKSVKEITYEKRKKPQRCRLWRLAAEEPLPKGSLDLSPGERKECNRSGTAGAVCHVSNAYSLYYDNTILTKW